MTLRRSSFAIINILNIPIGIVIRSSVNDGIITDIAIALIRSHFTVFQFSSSILLCPLFSIRQQLIEIHTKKFDFILVGICLSLQRRTKLCGNIREIRKVGCLIPSKVIAIIYSNLFRRFSTLCIDQNNTKGSTRTINRGRSGVFQYRDTFNILRIQERDIVHRNSIHHNQWITLFRVA